MNIETMQLCTKHKFWNPNLCQVNVGVEKEASAPRSQMTRALIIYVQIGAYGK